MIGKRKVISIAAVSGGGKTAVTTALGGKLKHSKVLSFDHYDFKDSPDDLIQWVENGADYNQWNLEPLIEDIESLLTAVEPCSFIILDYPFAYQNFSMKDYIDLTIFIDTPLDIAMGRRILRDHKNSSTADIHKEIRGYLNGGRPAYLEMLQKIKPDSDIVIDGTLPINKIVDIIIEEISRRF